MNSRTTFGALGGALLVAGLYAYSVSPSGYVERPVGASKHVALADGGAGCARLFGLQDGGAAWRTLLQCDCARKPADGGACALKDGGDPGTLNRLPMEWLAGAGCELVACSVYLGQNPSSADNAWLEDADAGAPQLVDAGVDAGGVTVIGVGRE